VCLSKIKPIFVYATKAFARLAANVTTPVAANAVKDRHVRQLGIYYKQPTWLFLLKI
jgi:hypothetical protein